jgi:hypothetical protein
MKTSRWRYQRIGLVTIYMVLTTSLQAYAAPPCAAAGDAGNSYENCASGSCERLVCNGSAYVPLSLWTSNGTMNIDLGNDTSTCDSTRAGRIRYTSTLGIEVCNGSTWDGTYKFGPTSVTCDSTQAGRTRYNTTTKKLEYCNETSWQSVQQIPDSSNIVCQPASNMRTSIPYNYSRYNTDAFGFCGTAGDERILCAGSDAHYVTEVIKNPLDFQSGNYDSCAIRSNGTIACWGDVDSVTTGIPSGSNYVKVAAPAWNNSHACAVTAGGGVTCWGNNANGETNVPGGITNASKVVVGEDHTCILRTTGAVTCWGVGVRSSVPAGATSNVTKIAAGRYSTCAVKSDGTVVCWGDNSNGETNVPSGITTAVDISGAINTYCILKSNNTGQCWGTGGSQNLSSISSIAAYYGGGCGIKL